MRGRDGLSTGDIGDPVADSIRAEQNRDAMPSPEEARRLPTCEDCGETSEDVQHRDVASVSCPAVQTPPDPFVPLCDDCYSERPTAREKALERARKRDDLEPTPDVGAVVFYECGNHEYAEYPDPDRPVRWRPRPSAKVECRCGAHVEDIVYHDEEDDDGGA